MRSSSGLARCARETSRRAGDPGRGGGEKAADADIPNRVARAGDLADERGDGERHGACRDQHRRENKAKRRDAGRWIALVQRREQAGGRRVEADLPHDRIEQRDERQKQRAGARRDEEAERHNDDRRNKLAIKAPAPNPNRDNRASCRADNWAETAGRCDGDRRRSAEGLLRGHHARVSGQAVALAQIAGRAGRDDILPGGRPALGARNHMVERQFVMRAAILAGEAVAQKHVKARKGRLTRRPYIGFERND